jgi:Fe-S cluster biosynthesis and repair protein YggX
LVREGEAQRQGILNTAANIITGQQELDEARNKVPIEIGGQTFNLHPSEAATLSYNMHALDRATEQWGVDKTLELLEHERKYAADAQHAKYLDAMINKYEYDKRLTDAKSRYYDAQTRETLRAANLPEDFDLDDKVKMGQVEEKIIEANNAGEMPNPSYVDVHNKLSSSDHVYLPYNKKGLFTGEVGVKAVPLPTLNIDGVEMQVTPRHLEHLFPGMPVAKRAKLIYEMKAAGSNLPSYSSGVRIVE